MLDYFKKVIGVFKDSLSGEERDYTVGSIKLAIVLLAIPMILELSLESLFAIVDIYFVGKISKEAVAIVGYTESVITIIYSVAIGLSTAATALVARRVGEKSFEEAAHSASQVIILAGIVTIVFSLLGVIFAPNILSVMGASEEVVSFGTPFTRVMFGTSGVIIYLFLINGIFRGAGNASIAMKSLWIASIFNIVVNPFFIFGIGAWAGFGLTGAAITTCLGRGLGVLYQYNALKKGKGILQLKASHFKPDWKEIKDIIQLAWPATFQFIIASGSWIVLTKIVAETGGTDASAAYQIAVRNLVFFILPAWGLSNAATTLIGQNLGAKQIDRAEKSVLLTAKYTVIFMAFVTLLFQFFPKQILGIYTDDESVIEIGTTALRVFGSGFIFYGLGMVMMQALNGAGDTKTPTWINFICFWLIQIPLAYALAYFFDFGFIGPMLAIPISEGVMALLAYMAFKKGNWKKIEI